MLRREDCLLGLLAQTMGNMDQAIVHFEDALAFCGKAGYRPELAWSFCDYADILIHRNNPGDRQKAMSLLDSNYGAIHIDNSPLAGSVSFLLKS